ncbi:MAG: ADP-ribosylglycohydrolase family protein [Albidovulum sp.]|nr:ADP-ribosylglycohydrolase family protein [Albidovulum sp.]
MTIPDDYLERVYAGVLGKLIGVYLGRPFEGWTYQRILSELGPIEGFVHDRLGEPLIVTDDDIAGTFTFPRALEDYSHSEYLTSREIGMSWLNYIVENRSILWWGGNGISTEHTAWLNLKRGLSAPESGSMATNGRTVAEQIGAQIFIDGWALVSPGNPHRAAKLARAAARVSHDGEAVHAAALWAAMESEAFVAKDIDHLIDTGLSLIPAGCLIGRLIADVRNWRAKFADWRDTRERIDENFGYHKFPGNCHVVPNHALMIMAVLYSPDDFHRAQTIVNTSGWDTDCNAGNVGCLLGIMLGLEGLDNGPDWRGPIADRMLISSSDGGNSVNDAVRISYYIANLGRALDGREPLPAPKGGARFHFSLPGSTQGFRIAGHCRPTCSASVEGIERNGEYALSINFRKLDQGKSIAAMTPTFATRDVLRMRTYELMATPLIYPGQLLYADVAAPRANNAVVRVGLMLRRYGDEDRLYDVEGEAVMLDPGMSTRLSWRLPDCGSQPIAEIGVFVESSSDNSQGKVIVDRMGWGGAPACVLKRPDGKGSFWLRAWVNSADNFSPQFNRSFHVSQNRGEGIVMHGTRQWADYKIETELVFHHGRYAGLAVRTQGLRRFYSATITSCGRFELARVRDDCRDILAADKLSFELGEPISMTFKAKGNLISVRANGKSIEADDSTSQAFLSGGFGLLVADGAMSVDAIKVSGS